MSRLRSDTYIKPGSESSFDSDEGPARRFGQSSIESYCCMANISLRKAIIGSAFATIIQAVITFYSILLGCGITMQDILVSFVPIITATLATISLSFSYLHQSATSIRPYIVHHLVFLVMTLLWFTLYMLVYFRQETALDIAENLAKRSSMFAALLKEDIKYLFGGYLVLQLLTSIICLHFGIAVYLVLDNVVRYISAEGTEIV
ncbi:unnamed protein product [Caenorhabditis bovis]|uniref:Uncharacterized protein n=1 Tax=Caenorhabditis bovis TaxID=2654633 RepID=A0A8S1EDQ2_9PELO|nr:unnamed protein product [Caenorhabditis bovis]